MEENLLKIGFDKNEAYFFAVLYRKLDDEDKKFLAELGAEFASGKGVDTSNDVQGRLKFLAEKYATNEKTVDMLFFLSNFDLMKEKYIKKGIDEEVIYATLKDFKYKLDECKKSSGLLGANSGTFSWYYYFINAEMFALGRLQFHEKKFFEDTHYQWGDITLTPDDTVIYTHIPSSGPLTRELRMDAYKKAFKFFGKKKGEHLVICCKSWLLYPGYKENFPIGSNLYDFMEDFTIIQEKTLSENNFPQSIVVFGMEYDGDTSKFPTDTTLQRNFIEYLNAGKPTGYGFGVIIFDGEKIVSNERDAIQK